jgi:hypothetical protein
MSYKMFQVGAGYQCTDNLYSSLTLESYDVDMEDGNSAFKAYRLHSMASGQHDKNKLMLSARYTWRRRVRVRLRVQLGSFDPDSAAVSCRSSPTRNRPRLRRAAGLAGVPGASAAGTA